MDGLARLWIVCAAEARHSAPEPALARLARLFASRRPAALYAPRTHSGRADLRTLATALEHEVRVLPRFSRRGSLPLALDAIASAHEGAEVLCWLPAGLAPAAVARVLSLPEAEPGAYPWPARHLQLVGLDWPAGGDAPAVPGLCGFDLDWLPPWQPARRFPGGPGVAASGRA